jgi:hypothetical protein
VLHRDIYWLGKHWAVTGHGIQTIDNKLEMKFDIEASRIWDEGLDEPVRAQPWFDPDDFRKALAIARQRSQESPEIFKVSFSDER